ncbi:MAG: S8 family serine peptidase [Chthoniobacterales bacterium]|nr:S8 family serine peptidase [Chthoniobacterales bacterium]
MKFRLFIATLILLGLGSPHLFSQVNEVNNQERESVNIQGYSQFLNQTSAFEESGYCGNLYAIEILGDSILRTGSPEDYCYHFIPTLDCSSACLAALSLEEATFYSRCCHPDSSPSLHSRILGSSSDIKIDPSLQSNILTFDLISSGVEIHQTGLEETVVEAGIDEIITCLLESAVLEIAIEEGGRFTLQGRDRETELRQHPQTPPPQHPMLSEKASSNPSPIASLSRDEEELTTTLKNLSLNQREGSSTQKKSSKTFSPESSREQSKESSQELQERIDETRILTEGENLWKIYHNAQEADFRRNDVKLQFVKLLPGGEKFSADKIKDLTADEIRAALRRQAQEADEDKIRQDANAGLRPHSEIIEKELTPQEWRELAPQLQEEASMKAQRVNEEIAKATQRPYEESSIFENANDVQASSIEEREVAQVEKKDVYPLSPDHLSEEEEEYYPQSTIISSYEYDGPEENQRTRVRVLKTKGIYQDNKHRYIRTEETIDKETGYVITHFGESIANHLLLDLPEGMSAKDFISKLRHPEFIPKLRDPEFISKLHHPEDTHLKLKLYQGNPHELVYEYSEESSLAEISTEIYNRIWEEFPSARCERNHIAHLDADSQGKNKKPDFSEIQWNLNKIQAKSEWCNLSLKNPDKRVIVAVIDSGIDSSHQALNQNIYDSFNGITLSHDIDHDVTDDVNYDVTDDVGHGSHVAGIIGGYSGNKFFGVAGKSVRLMICKAFDNDQSRMDSRNDLGHQASFLKSLRYAVENGANVINYSGSFGTRPSIQVLNALLEAQRKGVIIVLSAGNGKDTSKEIFNPLSFGSNLDDASVFPYNKLENDTALDTVNQKLRSFTPNKPSRYPLKYQLDNMVVVAATTADDKLAPFSFYGVEAVHIAAPGEYILSAWSNKKNGPSYKMVSGTSQAAPHVTGALALLMTRYPKENYPTATGYPFEPRKEEAYYQFIIRILLENAEKLPSLKGKIKEGRRLNIAKAMNPKN